jgi:hypothetical protein
MLHAGGQKELMDPDLSESWRTRLKLLICFYFQFYTVSRLVEE